LKPTPQLQPGAAQRLNEIQAPTLLIIGDADTAEARATLDYLEAHVGGAHRADLSNAVHWLNVEHPEDFNRLVLQFLSQHPMA
jgi:3-oxoadipate enol-lactonase